MPTYRCNHCSAEWSIPLDIEKEIAESLIAVSRNRTSDAQLIRALSKSFDLEKVSAMLLVMHSIKGNHCVSCAAPLSDLGRFTRHCTICGGINFDWGAVLADR